MESSKAKLFWVYVLYSEKIGKPYVGHTHSLHKRLKQHNLPSNTGWTGKGRPWKLIFKEKHVSRSNAIKREKYLKSFDGKMELREIVINYSKDS